eukprot:scaffold1556_cov163-Skeletonema_marinoi.AAC.4
MVFICCLRLCFFAVAEEDREERNCGQRSDERKEEDEAILVTGQHATQCWSLLELRERGEEVLLCVDG